MSGNLRIVYAIVVCLAVSQSAWPVEKGPVILDQKHPGVWQSDGMWKITPREEGVEFLKDETPAHNSMCWRTLPAPLSRGQTIEIVYRMQVPYKHIDLFLCKDCGRADANAPMPEFAEVVSLGGIESVGWQTRRLTITSVQPVNTLGLLAWGWQIDRGTWIRIATIRVLPEKPVSQWIVWRVPPQLNDKVIPARSPLQDFFPFGVYFPMEFGENYRYEGLKDRWEWYDRALADIKARGMNFTSVTNLGAEDLDRLAALHAKHGLRMNPQVGEFLIKLQGPASLVPFLRAVEKYRGNPVIAGWAVGEEFAPQDIPLLVLPYEIVRAVDPKNTLVTIHNSTEAFRQVGQLCDVRIAFRDIYPFFADPASGPVGHEASMNYYEDEIDKDQRLLPRGASLWVMPQAQHEYYGTPAHFVFRQPTPAEMSIQTWAALAHGAQGIAYFLYPSSAPAKPGEIPQNLALRTYDGKATPQLERLTALAHNLVPLGPIITRWQRTALPAATDQRDLRAYLFKGGDGSPYLVAFNHGVEQSVTGRLRIPFTSPRVFDLIGRKELKAAPIDRGQATIVSISLPPGEGTILRLSGAMPAYDELQEAVDTPMLSGRPRPDLPLTELPDGRKSFRYQVDFQKTEGVPSGDSLSTGLLFRDWPQLGQKHMNGVYGNDATFLFEMPDRITGVSAAGAFNNHADSKAYDYRILYSTDGKEFKPIVEKLQVIGGDIPGMSGMVQLPAGTRRVWVTYQIPGHNYAIVLKAVEVQLIMAPGEKKAVQ